MVPVHCTSPLMRSIHQQSFITIAYSFGDMLRTKFKYENKQRAITKKLSKRELWFLCTALPLDEIYPPMKFHNRTSIVLEICSGQRICRPPTHPTRLHTTGDNIIRPVFDGRIKRQKCCLPAFSPFPTLF